MELMQWENKGLGRAYRDTLLADDTEYHPPEQYFSGAETCLTLLAHRTSHIFNFH